MKIEVNAQARVKKSDVYGDTYTSRDDIDLTFESDHEDGSKVLMSFYKDGDINISIKKKDIVKILKVLED